MSIMTFGQDKEMFNYINTYRVENGVDKLRWSKDLYVISKEHNDTLVSEDSLYHSKTNTYENCGGSSTWTTPVTPTSLKEFNKFIDKYYNVTFDPNDTTEFNKFIKLSVIYAWSNSDGHNKNLLRDIKYGSVSTYVGEFTYIPNTKTVSLLGKTAVHKFDGILPYYVGVVYSTFNGD
jgi:hypothetical protein